LIVVKITVEVPNAIERKLKWDSFKILPLVFYHGKKIKGRKTDRSILEKLVFFSSL